MSKDELKIATREAKEKLKEMQELLKEIEDNISTKGSLWGLAVVTLPGRSAELQIAMALLHEARWKEAKNGDYSEVMDENGRIV